MIEKELETNSNKIYNHSDVNVQSIDVQMLTYEYHPAIYNVYSRTETSTVYPPVLF